MKLAGHRVREDREARRFWRDLQREMSEHVPEGKSVVLTLQAPIRQANKTNAALCEKIVRQLARGARSARWEILGNRIRIRILDEELETNVMGFVFTDDVNPDVLLNALPRS